MQKLDKNITYYKNIETLFNNNHLNLDFIF